MNIEEQFLKRRQKVWFTLLKSVCVVGSQLLISSNYLQPLVADVL